MDFGYFAFNAEGSVDHYDGVTCEKLENGYVRVTFDMKELSKISGTPNNVIEFLYVRGAWTNAGGEITNICLYWDNIDTQKFNVKIYRGLDCMIFSKNRIEEVLEEGCPAD